MTVEPSHTADLGPLEHPEFASEIWKLDSGDLLSPRYV
jgi:hypothetical protein